MNQELPDIQAGFRKGRGCQELTHLKRPWCWERLRVGGEGDHRGWDGWMASPTPWTRVWVSSGSWWWTGRPSVLQSMGLQRVIHDWVTELNWGTRNVITNILWIIEKAGELKKKKSASFTVLKPSTVWITINWKILERWECHTTFMCLLRNLYAGQEATVRMGCGTMDQFKIGKGECQGCILLPC